MKTFVKAFAEERHAITENGKKVKLTSAQLVVKTLLAKAMEGDVGANIYVEQLRHRFTQSKTAGGLLVVPEVLSEEEWDRWVKIHNANVVQPDAHESTECRDRFERWAKGVEPAEFFLDAVDEAKLPQARTVRPLRDALRELTLTLGPHLRRISLFVSCRSSEWLDDVEQKALDQFARSVSTGADAADSITVFNASFTPLDLARIRLLARDRGGEEAINSKPIGERDMVAKE